MSIADVITIGREALIITMLIAAPLLGGTLFVGVVIGILQAATSIQEMTLSFIPKLIVLVVTLFFFGGWSISEAFSKTCLSIFNNGLCSP